MSQKYTIREFKQSDNDQIYTLILSILENEFKEIPPDEFLKDIQNLQKNYSGNGNRFMVCESEGTILGTIAVKRDDEKTALLRRFFVNPNFRGKSIGKNLLEGLIQYCKEEGYKKIIFTGNNRFHHVKQLLTKFNFAEEEDIFLEGIEIFKLSLKL